MPNTNLTVDWIGNEALALAHEKAVFIGTINKQFDPTFRPGYGNAIRIRLPSQYSTRTGRTMDVEDGVQQSTALVVATQWGVDMRYNSQEMAQDLVNFRKLHLIPAMSALVSKLDAACLELATISTYNFAGTANTAITTLVAPGQARARLNQYLAPKDSRCLQIDSITMGGLVNGVAAYFNPSNAISEQYREGLVARTSMADYYENERVMNMVNAATSTVGTLSTFTITDGAVSINVSNVFAAPNSGQLFTIAGIFACHPETKEAYSHLQSFTVTGSDMTGTTVSFNPPIRITGARKNVSRSNGDDLIVSSLTTAAVTFIGNGTSTYSQPLMYHPDAYTFATAELPLMSDAIECTVKTVDGISLRVWSGSDIRNDEKLTRIDILWGFSAIRPEWGCRLYGTGV